MIHAPGSWSCPVRSPMNLELQQFDILTTQDLTHQHFDRLLVENGKLVFVPVLLSHVDLPLIALLVSGSIPEQSQKHIGHLDDALVWYNRTGGISSLLFHADRDGFVLLSSAFHFF